MGNKKQPQIQKRPSRAELMQEIADLKQKLVDCRAQSEAKFDEGWNAFAFMLKTKFAPAYRAHNNLVYQAGYAIGVINDHGLSVPKQEIRNELAGRIGAALNDMDIQDSALAEAIQVEPGIFEVWHYHHLRNAIKEAGSKKKDEDGSKLREVIRLHTETNDHLLMTRLAELNMGKRGKWNKETYQCYEVMAAYREQGLTVSEAAARTAEDLNTTTDAATNNYYRVMRKNEKSISKAD